MTARVGFALGAGLLLCSAASAQTQVIVQDNFDSYADTAAFQAVWVPTTGNGSLAANAADVTAGILTNDPLSTFEYPDLQGEAVDHIGATLTTPGMVNQYGGVINQLNGQDPEFTTGPSETQSVFLSADIFESGGGNERMSVGLRYVDAAGATVATTNILELGFWNANPTVLDYPGVPQDGAGNEVSTGYAWRVINFGTATEPDTRQPNWQFFKLPQELDRTTDTDELVNIGDVGAGWHRYTATFTPTEITLTIDLFRDGVRNVSKTPGDGTPGVDAEVNLTINTLPVGFNSLRIGGPSGASSPGAGAMAFDNILLQLQPAAVATDDADFDGDGDVDGADFLTWQQNLGLNNGSATLAQGDANGDMNVDGLDLSVWQNQFGTTAAAGAAASVPEPASAVIASAMLLGLASFVRRRT